MSKPVTGGLFKRGGVYYARWKAGGKRYVVSTGIKVRQENAKDRARAILAEKVRPFQIQDGADRLAALVRRAADAERKANEAQSLLPDSGAMIRVADAWEKHPYEWSQPTRNRSSIHKLSPLNIVGNRQGWERFVRFIVDRRGRDVTLGAVTIDDAKAYADSLKATGMTPSRYNLLVCICNVMYRLASCPSPFAAVPRLVPQTPESREPFSRSQVRKLLASAEGEWLGFLATLYYTGLRVGDAVHLSAEHRANGKLRVLTSKTGAKIDQLENPALTSILAHVSPQKHGLLFPSLAAVYDNDHTRLSYQFARYAGRVLADSDGKPFDGTEQRANGLHRISRWGLHSFRHSFASHAAEKGVPLPIVQRYLGHATATITQIYAMHASDEAARALVAAVSLDD